MRCIRKGDWSTCSHLSGSLALNLEMSHLGQGRWLAGYGKLPRIKFSFRYIPGTFLGVHVLYYRM